MHLHEVKTTVDKRRFLDVPLKIYRNDANWVRPLDKDIEMVFDPAQNKFFKRGECARWILVSGSGEDVGRVAAFYHKGYKMEQPTGGIGFFECPDDQAAANFMFDHCRAWLQERGMEAMDGPINFGERDRWWGLQVEGFQEPLYCMNYNLPYYQSLFETYGWGLYFNQICFSMSVDTQLTDKFFKRHAEVSKDPAFRAVRIKKTDLPRFAKDFTYIYNRAWAGHGGGKEIDERTVNKMFAKMKPVMDEDISWFAYHNDEPIAMWINLPDLNQWFKKLNGKFGLLQKIRFLLLKTFTGNSRFVGIVFGVIPAFQGKGIDAYIVTEAAKVIQGDRRKYDKYEMLWIGDFNPKMINIAESLGTERSRKLTTYRYLFDRTKEMNRHPMVG